MAYEVSSITPDLVTSQGKIVISADEGKTNVTINRLDISGLEQLAGAEMQSRMLKMAEDILNQALQALWDKD